ncbi:MAG: hypothetical protein HND51_10315 [Chloroflexi bacterium]|nr:hypothetical protein [Chloroflexota bacterium]
MADRIVVAVRWLGLISLAALAFAGDEVSTVLQTLFFLGGVGNFILTGLTLFRRRLPSHEYVSIAADVILASLLFRVSGTINGSLIWAGLLPVVTGAVYYAAQGGLLGAMLSLIGMSVMAFFDTSVSETLRAFILPSIVFLGGGLVLGFLSRNASNELKQRLLSEVGIGAQSRRLARNRIQAVYDITAKLNSTLNYSRVLDLALDVSNQALAQPGRGTPLVSAFYLYNGGMLEVGSARRYTPSDMRVTLRGKRGLLASAINAGTPRFMKNPSADPEFRRIVALSNCKSVYCYPLKSGLDVYGVLIFGSEDENYFVEENREILNIVGRNAQVSLQNARLYQELEEEKQRIIQIQEETQQKLARDLHDGPTQSVAAIAMRVNFARRLMERDINATGEELFKIEDLARRTTKEIRHMLFTLRPLVLESSGLVPALESMAEKMDETYEQKVSVEADPGIDQQLESRKQAVAFYLVEEATNNARKHAEAEHIWIRIKPAGEDLVLLEIEDDGEGFDLSAVEATYDDRGSLGLLNMRERAELISSVLQIDSRPKRGTRVRVWIPLTEAAIERIKNA